MIEQILIRGFDNNFSYFIWDGKNKDIAIVDPGDADNLIAEINVGGWIPKMILITHSHFDHIEGIGRLVEEYGIPVYMHLKAIGKIEFDKNIEAILVGDGDVINIGEMAVRVLYTPGHIDDAVCYYIDGENALDGVPRLVTGDTLFIGSCGRADLETSNVMDLFKSLERLKSLDDETLIYSGHDYGSKPVSTIGAEKKYNKFLKPDSLEDFWDLFIA